MLYVSRQQDWRMPMSPGRTCTLPDAAGARRPARTLTLPACRRQPRWRPALQLARCCAGRTSACALAGRPPPHQERRKVAGGVARALAVAARSQLGTPCTIHAARAPYQACQRSADGDVRAPAAAAQRIQETLRMVRAAALAALGHLGEFQEVQMGVAQKGLNCGKGLP